MLAFNGSSDYLTLPITPATTGFNLAFWAIKRNFTNNARIFDCQDAGPEDGFTVVEITNGTNQFVTRNGASATGSLTSVRNVNADLVHYVYTHDGTTSKLYENGVLIATDTSSVMSATSQTVLTIAKRAPGSTNYWNGKLGEVVLHNTATPWTQEQITALYTNGIIPSGASYWLFNGDVLDGSGNGNHGTLTGGTYIDRTATRASATRSEARGNYEIKQGTLLESFQTIGDWTASPASPGTIAISTDGYESKDALAITSATSANNKQAIRTINRNFSYGVGCFTFMVKPDNYTDTVVIGFSSETSFATKYFNASISSTSLKKNKWNLVRLAKSDFTATGGESWDNTMIRMRFRNVSNSASTPSTALFDDLRINKFTRAVCIFETDNIGNKANGVDKMVPIIEAYGWRGTINVQSNIIGILNACSSGDLATLRASGWDMANHTVDHADLTSLSVEEAVANVSQCRDTLISLGLTGAENHIAYPVGATSDELNTALKDAGFLTGRKTTNTTQIVPVADFFSLDEVSLESSSITLIQAKAKVDEAIQKGRTVRFMIEGLHDSAPSSIQWLTSDYQALVDYVREKEIGGQILVRKVTEWYDGLFNPRTTVTTRTAV